MQFVWPREFKIWEQTHLLNLTGTNNSGFYYANGFLLVQVKTSRYENQDKILYFPNPAVPKELAENTPMDSQMVIIKNTNIPSSSLNFLTTDYENLTLSNKNEYKWKITPIFSIENSFVKGVKAEFIRYGQRGNVTPSIERSDYKKVMKQALDLQKKKLQAERDDEIYLI